MSATAETRTEPAGQDERAVRRTVARHSRPRRTVPAVIVALLLALVSLVVAIEVISRLFDRPLGLLPVDTLTEFGNDTQWDDPVVLTIAVIVALIGLWLLVLAFLPGRVRHRPLRSTRRNVVVAMAADDLQRLAAKAAEEVDGVDRARASVDNGRIGVRVDSSLHDPANLGDEVREAVDDRIGQLDLQQPPAIRVQVRHRKE